jgi:beta-lactamase class A
MDFTQGPNTMSPASMALLLSKLYAGTLLNKQHTQALLSYMLNTNNETLIPAALPKNYTTYHKYGDLDDELHDAAIIVHGNQKFAVVIYTKGSGLVATRTKLIHEVTQAIVSTYSL